MTQPLHVVLGASGGAGNAIMGALAGRGHAVRGVNRSGSLLAPEGVEAVSADITDPAGASAALAGAVPRDGRRLSFGASAARS